MRFLARTYQLLVLAMLLLMAWHCQRIEPDLIGMDGQALRSQLNDRVVLLDTLQTKLSHQTGSIYYFNNSAQTDQLSKGDMIGYHDGALSFFGRLISSLHDGSMIGLEIAPLTINELFAYLSVRDTIRTGISSADILLADQVIQTGDSLKIAKLKMETFSGLILQGYVRIDSLLLVEQAHGEQFSYLLPSWENRQTTRDLKLEWNQTVDLSLQMSLYSFGTDQLQDSILFRSRSFPSYDAAGFAVEYVVEDWLFFSWSIGNPYVIKANISGIFNSDVSALFRADSWDTQFDEDNQKLLVALQDWDQITPVALEVRMNHKLYTQYCGSEGPAIQKNTAFQLSATTDWPQWQSQGSFSTSIQLNTDDLVFKDLPSSELQTQGQSMLLYDESGVLENEAPVAALSISPPTGFVNTDFKLNASASSDREDEANELLFRWDFDGDEVWDTPYSNQKVVTRRYIVAGNYTIRLEVQDRQGATDIASKSLLVHSTSSAPIAAFTISPDSGKVAEYFTFDASTCYDAEDPLSVLEVRWDFQNDGEWDTHFSTRKAEGWIYSEAQTYVVKLEVKDSDGLTGSTTRLLEVKSANIKPTAFFTVAPENGTTETRFNFDATGSSDVEDDVTELQVRWDWENDGTWDTEYRLFKTVTHQFAVAGVYQVVMEVIDTDGFSNFYSRTITVSNPNTKPTAGFTITPRTGTVNTKFTFDASISTDHEDDLSVLEVRWDWNNDDIYDTEYTTTKTITRQFDTAGPYIIKVMVRDSGGLTSTKADILIIQ